MSEQNNFHHTLSNILLPVKTSFSVVHLVQEKHLAKEIAKELTDGNLKTKSNCTVRPFLWLYSFVEGWDLYGNGRLSDLS